MIVLNEAKPKYDKLDELLDEPLTNIRFSNSVNMIIDLKDILKKFFRPDVSLENFSKRSIIETLTSDVINTIGHFRNYFYKKGKYSTFYILFSEKKCESLLKIYPSYKEDYYKKFFPDETADDDIKQKASIISAVVAAVKRIASLIPSVYYIDSSKFDELVYMKYIKEKLPTNELIFIFTNDEAAFQLISSNVFILTIKGIKSELVNEKNWTKILFNKDESDLSPGLAPLLFSISGIKRYSLKGIPHFALVKSYNIVNALLKAEKLVNADSVGFPLSIGTLDKENKVENLIIENWRDIVSLYIFIKQENTLYSNKLIISSDFVYSKKLQSVEQLKDLNAKIFTTFPLQLDMLLKGEKV